MPQELKKIECYPKCGFMVRSHNEKELIQIAIQHVKNIHNLLLTEKEAKARIEPAYARKDKILS